jgi:hypothetical protein
MEKAAEGMAALRVAPETGHLRRHSSIKYRDIFIPRSLQLAFFRRDRRGF